MYDSLVLFSGGLDSSTLLHDLKKNKKKIRCIYFNLDTYPTHMELYSVKKTTFNLDIPVDIVDLTGIRSMTRGCLPRFSGGEDELDIGAYRKISGFYVLLSTAVYYAHLTNIQNIEIAATKEQFDNIKGLQKFFDEFPHIIKLLNNDTADIKINYPFITSYKKDIIQLGKKLELTFEDTWSCFLGKEEHCGECNNCLARKNAFKSASISDPTTYLT